MNKYSLKGGDTDKDKHDEMTSKIDSLVKPNSIDDIKHLDESNPMERAIKFDKVKRDPPSPGYMKVELFEEEDKNGNRIVISKDTEGTEIKHDPIFTVDLKTSIDADITGCPSNVMPMLIDEAVQLAMNEKKEFKPEKRRDEFNYWWLVMGLLMLPGIILVILLFLG